MLVFGFRVSSTEIPVLGSKCRPFGFQVSGGGTCWDWMMISRHSSAAHSRELLLASGGRGHRAAHPLDSGGAPGGASGSWRDLLGLDDDFEACLYSLLRFLQHLQVWGLGSRVWVVVLLMSEVLL